MLTIRLTRVGKKKDSSFRLVVIESKRKIQAGNYLEMVGSYDPRIDKVDLKADRIKHWISMGATVSDTVHNLLVSNKIIDAKKINVLPKKTVEKKEEPAQEQTPEANADTAPAVGGEQKESVSEAPVEEAPAEAPAEDNSVVEEQAAQ